MQQSAGVRQVFLSSFTLAGVHSISVWAQSDYNNKCFFLHKPRRNNQTKMLPGCRCSRKFFLTTLFQWSGKKIASAQRIHDLKTVKVEYHNRKNLGRFGAGCGVACPSLELLDSRLWRSHPSASSLTLVLHRWRQQVDYRPHRESKVHEILILFIHLFILLPIFNLLSFNLMS